MTYKYVAYTVEKKVVKGTLGVSSESVAAGTLEKAGLRILSLKKMRKWDIEKALPTLYAVKARDVVLFSRQMAMLLERGTGFLKALQLSRDQTTSKALRRVITEIIKDAEAGITFSAALAKHPQTFPLSYNRMMNVGEQTGKLEVVLREVATDMERNEVAKKKVKGAMVYPVFILILGLVTVSILVTAVLPPLTRLFTEFDAQLPFTTRLLIGLTDFFSSYLLHLFGAVILLIFLVTWYRKQPSRRYHLEKLLLKAPVIGRIILIHSMSQFSRVMSMLLGAGLPMTEVMTVARQSAQSETVRQGLGDIYNEMFQGKRLSQAMKASRLFPSMLVQMVMTGEETNSLDNSFAALADHYESEFDEALAMLTSILQPLMMLVVGLVVGFIAVSIIMPMYSVYNLMG